MSPIGAIGIDPHFAEMLQMACGMRSWLKSLRTLPHRNAGLKKLLGERGFEIEVMKEITTGRW